MNMVIHTAVPVKSVPTDLIPRGEKTGSGSSPYVNIAVSFFACNGAGNEIIFTLLPLDRALAKPIQKCITLLKHVPPDFLPFLKVIYCKKFKFYHLNASAVPNGNDLSKLSSF